MKRHIYCIVLCLFCLMAAQNVNAQQNDSSSYFPLGLWGIWLHPMQAPFSAPLNAAQWSQEKFNWQNIQGNFLSACWPKEEEDTISTFASEINYRVWAEERFAEKEYFPSSYSPADSNAQKIWWWIADHRCP